MENHTSIEHPYVTRARKMINPPHSPMLTIKDFFQPSHGRLGRITRCTDLEKEITHIN